MSRIICGVLACVWGLGLAGAVFADNPPTADDLNKAQATLISAQDLIAGKDKLDDGLAQLATIQAVAQANFAPRWTFVTALANVVKSEKGGNAAAAAQALATLAGTSVEADESADVIVVTQRLVSSLTQAGQNGPASDLVSAVAGGPIAGQNVYRVHRTIAGVWFGLQNMPNAEAELVKSAGLVQTAGDSDDFGWSALNYLLQLKLDDQLAAFGRLATAAQAPACAPAMAIVTNKLLVAASAAVTNGDTDTASKIITALKAHPGTLAANVSAAEQQLAISTLLGAKDYASAMKALQQASDLRDQMGPDQAKVFYNKGYDLAQQLLTAGQTQQAKDIVNLLASGVGKKVWAFTLQSNLAHFDNQIGDTDDAMAALRLAAPMAQDAVWQDILVYEAWLIAGKAKSTDDALKVYDQLVDAFKTSPGLADRLLRKYLDKVKTDISDPSRLTSFKDMSDWLAAVKARDGGMDALANDVKLAEQLLAVQTLAGANDYASAMKALQQASDLGTQLPDGVATALYKNVCVLVTQLLKAGQTTQAKDLVELLASGVGKRCDPWQFQMDMAGFYVQLGDTVNAEAALAVAAPLSTTDDKKAAVLGAAWVLAAGAKSTDEAFAVYDNVAAAFKTAGIAETFLRKYLDKANVDLSSNWKPENAKAVSDWLAALKSRAVGMPALAGDEVIAEQFLAIRILADGGGYDDILKALNDLCVTFKDNPAVLGQVYNQASSIFNALLTAGKREPAEAFVKFLARDEMAKVVGYDKPDDQWKNWAIRAREVMRLCAKADELVATYENLIAVAGSDVAKEFLTGEMLAKASPGLGGEWTPEGVSNALAIFNSAKPHAAGVASLAGYLQLDQCLANARTYARTGNYDAAVAAIQESFKYAQGTAQDIKLQVSLAENLIYTQMKLTQRHIDDSASKRAVASMLEKAMGDTLSDSTRDALLNCYCDYAVIAGRGANALDTLKANKAKPLHYLALGWQYRRTGDEEDAKKALAAIPDEELQKDAGLADAVAAFWPTELDRVKDQLTRAQTLLGVYQQRQQDAQTANDTGTAGLCAAAVRHLQERIAALQTRQGELTKPAGN